MLNIEERIFCIYQVSFAMSSLDLLAKLRAEVTHWCCRLQQEREEKGEDQGAPPLRPPYRLISHGHELTPDLDHKTIGELGMKDQQVIYVTVKAVTSTFIGRY